MKKSMVFEGIVTILAIVLIFLLYVMVATGSPKDYNWAVAGSGPVLNVHLGEDGTLYAFTGAAGNTVYAIDNNGTVRWKYQVPGQWSVVNTLGHGVPYTTTLSDPPDEPVFATDNGTLYLYVRENSGPSPEERLLAISDGGISRWSVPVGNGSEPYSDVRVSVENGRIYAYADYKVTVLDEAGSALFAVDRVSDPPAVDERGNMYLSVSKREDSGPGRWAYQEPMGTIVSYNPVGSVEWAKTINGTLVRPDVAESLRPLYGSLPIYQDGLLYVPVRNGIEVLYSNGSVKWSREFPEDSYHSLFSLLPIDRRGNVYLSGNSNAGAALTILDPDGHDLAGGEAAGFDWQTVAYGDPYRSRIYSYDGIEFHGPAALENLITYDVAAYDLPGNRKLWDFAIPVEKKGRLIVNKYNVETLDVLDHSGEESYLIMNNSGRGIGSRQSLVILPSKDGVYLSFYTVNYQEPVVFGQSGCVYSGAIYALGEDGALVWSKPTDSFAPTMAANNSTIYYGTKGGEMVSARVDNVVGGIALIAVVYLLVRFFLVGAVARARARLNKNENRYLVFDFIAGNPGSTAHEISRGTGMNLGTVRYHMFILGMDHKITASRADGKYVRYFTNSNSFSKDEQLVFSLMRRDAVGKVLGLILEKPGVSNVEIAGELDLQESVVCRCVKELSEKGVIARDPGRARGAYSVPDAYREPVADAIRRLQGQ